MTRALVTGATGFVGSNLVAHLRQLEWEVECLVRDVTRASHLQQIGATLRRGDLSDGEHLRLAMAGKQVVFHVAGRIRALHESQFTRDNVDGTRHVMKACAAQSEPPTVVLVSSLAAGGPSAKGQPRCETDADSPISAYGRSKLAAEKAAAALAGDVPLSILRPPIVFGQADRASLAIFRSVKWTRIHTVPGFRSFPVSVVHIADLCHALVRIADEGTRVMPGENGTADVSSATYHVAAERTITYGELGAIAGQSMGYRTLVVPLPKALFWLVGGLGEIWGNIRRQPAVLNLDKIREAVAPGWECCDHKIRDELGYQPAATLEDRFAETTAWYREQGWL